MEIHIMLTENQIKTLKRKQNKKQILCSNVYKPAVVHTVITVNMSIVRHLVEWKRDSSCCEQQIRPISFDGAY